MSPCTQKNERFITVVGSLTQQKFNRLRVSWSSQTNCDWFVFSVTLRPANLEWREHSGSIWLEHSSVLCSWALSGPARPSMMTKTLPIECLLHVTLSTCLCRFYMLYISARLCSMKSVQGLHNQHCRLLLRPSFPLKVCSALMRANNLFTFIFDKYCFIVVVGVFYETATISFWVLTVLLVS